MAYSLEPLPAADVDPNQVGPPMLEFTSEELQQLKTLPLSLQQKVALLTERLSERLQHVRYLEDQLGWATEKITTLSPQVHELESETLRLTQENTALSHQVAAATERESLLLASSEPPKSQIHASAEPPPPPCKAEAGAPISRGAILPFPSPAPLQAAPACSQRTQAATRAVSTSAHSTESNARKVPPFSIARPRSQVAGTSIARSPVVPLPEGIRRLLISEESREPGGMQVVHHLERHPDDLPILHTPASHHEDASQPLSSTSPPSPSLRRLTVSKLVQRIERLQQQLDLTARGGERDAIDTNYELDRKVPRSVAKEDADHVGDGLRASFGAWGEAHGVWHQNPLYTPEPVRWEQLVCAAGDDVVRADASAKVSMEPSADRAALCSESLVGATAGPPAVALSYACPDSALPSGQVADPACIPTIMHNKVRMLVNALEPTQSATHRLDFTFEAVEADTNLAPTQEYGYVDKTKMKLGRQCKITDPMAKGSSLDEAGDATSVEGATQAPGGHLMSYVDARWDQLTNQNNLLARLAASLQAHRETLEASHADVRRAPNIGQPPSAGGERLSLQDLERLAELQDDKATMLMEALGACQAKLGSLELENRALRDLASRAGLHLDGQEGRREVATIDLVEMTALMCSVNQHLPSIRADHDNQLALCHSSMQDLWRQLLNAEDELMHSRHSLQEAQGTIAWLEESSSKQASCASVATATDLSLCRVVCAGVQTDTLSPKADQHLPEDSKIAQPNPQTVLFARCDLQTHAFTLEHTWEHERVELTHGKSKQSLGLEPSTEGANACVEEEDAPLDTAHGATTDVLSGVESAPNQQHVVTPTKESSMQTEKADEQARATQTEAVAGSPSSPCSQEDAGAAGGSEAAQLVRLLGSALQSKRDVEASEAGNALVGSGAGAGKMEQGRESEPCSHCSAATQTPVSNSAADSDCTMEKCKMAEAQALVSSLKEELVAAQTTLDEKALALANVQQRIAKMEEEAERLREESSSLTQVHHQHTLDQEAGEAALKRQLEAMQSVVGRLEGELVCARREIAGYETTVQGYQEAQAEKDDTVQGYHATLETLQADLAAANHTVDSLEQLLKRQNAELVEEIANHKTQQSLLEEQISDLQGNVKAKITELASAYTETEKLQQRCINLQEDVRSLTNIRSATETELQGVRHQLLAESEMRTEENREALLRAQEARRGMETAEAGKEAALASAHEKMLGVQELLRVAEERAHASAQLEQSLRHQLTQQAEDIESSHTKISSLASDLAGARMFGEEMARAVDSLRAHVQSLSTTHQADVAAAKESYEEAMRAAAEAHQVELYQLHSMHEVDVAKSQKEHAADLDALRQEAAAAAQHHQKVLSQHVHRLSQLESEKRAADEEHKVALKVAEEQHKKEMEDTQSASRRTQEKWRTTLAEKDSRQQQLFLQQQQQQQQEQLHLQQQQQQALQKAEAEHQAEVRRLKKRLSKQRAQAASHLEGRTQKMLQEHAQQMDGLRLQMEVSAQQARAAEEKIQHVSIDLAQAQTQLVAARAEGTENAAKLKFAREEVTVLLSEREERLRDDAETDERASTEFQQSMQEVQKALATSQAEGAELRDKTVSLEKKLFHNSRQHANQVSQLEAVVTEHARQLKEAKEKSDAADDELAATHAALDASQRKLEAQDVHVVDLQLQLSEAESRVAKRDIEADRLMQDGRQTVWILNKQLETLGESLAKKEEELRRQAHHLADREARVKSSERHLAHALEETDKWKDTSKATLSAWERQLGKQCLPLDARSQENLRRQSEAEMEDLRRAHNKQLAQVTLRCRQLEGALKCREAGSHMVQEDICKVGRFFLGEMADLSESAGKTIDEFRKENAEQNTALRDATRMIKALQADQFLLERQLHEMSAPKRLVNREVTADSRSNNISTLLSPNNPSVRQFSRENYMHESFLGVRDTTANVQIEHIAMGGPLRNDFSRTHASLPAERSGRHGVDPSVYRILAEPGIRTQLTIL